MDNFLKFVLIILCFLVLFQLIYSYITFTSFTCPECPECPILKDELIPPSNQYFVNYINKNFVEKVDDDIKSIDFLKKNILFANNYQVNFQLDAESVMSKIRNEFQNNNQNFTKGKLKYIQSTDAVKIKQFNDQYKIENYPSPLIYFEGSNLLFGFIENKWKILIDISKYQ